MLSTSEIDDLLHLRLPEEDAQAIIAKLTPDVVDEKLFAAFLEGMAACSVPIPDLPGKTMDCCGTGGSGLPHYNTSTTVAFILAAGGVPMVKFGNRAMTSLSGSFDFLEAIGIPATFPLQDLPELLSETGLVFLFAPQCYPALARFNALRRALGIRSIFNFMGPLLNPVQPAFRLLGVSDTHMQTLMANRLAQQPHLKKALVVSGPQHLDEIAVTGETLLLEVTPGQVASRIFQPDFIQSSGFFEDTDISMRTPEANWRLFKALIYGEDMISDVYQMVCLNAGAGFYTARRVPDIETGTMLAAELLASKKVLETVETCWRAYARYTR